MHFASSVRFRCGGRWRQGHRLPPACDQRAGTASNLASAPATTGAALAIGAASRASGCAAGTDRSSRSAAGTVSGTPRGGAPAGGAAAGTPLPAGTAGGAASFGIAAGKPDAGTDRCAIGAAVSERRELVSASAALISRMAITLSMNFHLLSFPWLEMPGSRPAGPGNPAGRPRLADDPPVCGSGSVPENWRTRRDSNPHLPAPKAGALKPRKVCRSGIQVGVE